MTRLTIIAEEAARAVGTDVNDLLADRRGGPALIARHIAFVLARDLTRLSLPKIGHAFRRDHTTVLHALRAWPARVAKHPALAVKLAIARDKASARLAARAAARDAALAEAEKRA